MIEITLYHTSACHLCDKAKELLWPILSSGSEYRLIEVDIADSDALIEAFGLRIPVLTCKGHQLNWPFDSQQILEFLTPNL